MSVIDGSKEPKLLTAEEQRRGVGEAYVKSQGVPAKEDKSERNWHGTPQARSHGESVIASHKER